MPTDLERLKRVNENKRGLIPEEVQMEQGENFYAEFEAMSKAMDEDQKRELILEWDDHIRERMNIVHEGELVGMEDAEEDEDITLPFHYEPRDYQLEFWNMFNINKDGELIEDKHRWPIKEKYKRIIFIWHRRAGKDLDTWNRFLFIAALRPGIYWYFLPTKAQAKKVIFEGRDNNQRRFIDYLPMSLIDDSMFRNTTTGWNKQDMSTKLKNGSVIQILGSDNYDSLVGANAAGCVFSEWSLCDPVAWNYIEPMILAQNGFAWFIYTPRGRNHGYDLYKSALEDADNWIVSHLTVEDTNWEIFNKKQIENLRKKTPESKIQSEYFVNFDAPVEEAFYSEQIINVYNEDRYLNFEYQKGIPVKVAFDLGMSDKTTLTFFQEYEGMIVVLYYYESEGESIEHYIREIDDFEKRSGCSVSKLIFPHDANVREITSGKTRLNIIRDMTNKQCIVLKKDSLYEGINNVRRILPKTIFYNDKDMKFTNKKRIHHCGTKLLLQRLSTYKKKKHKKTGQLLDEPVHDINSHAADSFRYLAMNVDKYKIDKTDIKVKIKQLRD